VQFQPKTEAEIKAMMLQHNGIYDFEVVEAEEGVSKSGNDMIVLKKVTVFSPNGTQNFAKDWLVGSDAPLCLAKLQGFCRTTGIIDKYMEGSLTAFDCEGLAGKCRVAISEDPQYGRQVKIAEYIVHATDPTPEPSRGVPAAQTTAANKAADERAAAAGFPDPEIPF
jgi:hypothetical protein